MASQLADTEQRRQTHIAPAAARLKATVFEGRRAVEALAASHGRQSDRSRRRAERGQCW